jgi:L-serine dehydratase
MIVSIFNDVIGPVMRGPSSSHCAAALRIGRLARDLMDGDLKDVRIDFGRLGALATTHASQGSDMGLFGGLLGWDTADERLPDSARALLEAGIRVRIEIGDFGDEHPNTYRLSLGGKREHHSLTAVSTGGGMIEITRVDDFPVSIGGDHFETLVFLDRGGSDAAHRLADAFAVDEILVHETAGRQLVEVKAQQFVSDEIIAHLLEASAISRVKRLAPVLPVLSRKGLAIPFTTCAEMLDYDAGRGTPLWRLAAEYEMARGNLAEAEVMARMADMVRIVRRSIGQGIAGTQYRDRILGHQSGGFKERMEEGRLLPAGVFNRIVLYVSALMEVKSSMGVIVAAPTAGACAALPGSCIAVADEMGRPDEAAARALLAGGIIGAFIAARSTFAAEVAGCQAECGSAAAMAAAALVSLADGAPAQALAAASMALQNSIGWSCDPVAGRVEVPCLGKNVLAAANALACANMALASYDAVIPLDEVIEAAGRAGRSLPRELRCTALGGLSATPTARKLEGKLAGS